MKFKLRIYSLISSGAYAQYYYAMGLAFLVFNISALVATIFPFAIAKRIGCTLLLIGTLLSSFIMIQVQAIVIVDARAYSGT